jgi:predicted SprT family Zn-dependent metalloprotease
MILADAEKLALELMRQFGLTNWRFEFDDAKRRFGVCHRGGSKIGLSRELTLLNEQGKVEDTIRHEIAHALCPPRSGHGPAWKAMCLRTGAKPERCYSEEVDAPKGDWQATCRACGRQYTKFRRPKGNLFCADKKCRTKLLPYVESADGFTSGRFHPERRLVWRHKDALPEAAPNPEARRKAVEAMKARLKSAEPETTPELIYQCAKCDRKSISFHGTCPVCSGDMMLESKLKAEKEELKRRIAELEAKLGVKK